MIASLNGTTPGGWTHYATALQDEGADALELNIYLVAADVDLTGAEVEDRTCGWSSRCGRPSTSRWR